ncbi:hypothetical protein LH612_36310, partial [Klebsiella pneumoniae]|nr:hypothetical protein [Klebsiella pneumoniae]
MIIRAVDDQRGSITAGHKHFRGSPRGGARTSGPFPVPGHWEARRGTGRRPASAQQPCDSVGVTAAREYRSGMLPTADEELTID